MKKYMPLLLIICIIASCKGKKPDEQETKKQAEEVNKAKFVSKADEKDAQFLVDMVAGNNAEIHMAEIAIKRSQNDELKQIANLLIKDHTLLLNALKKMAAEKDISIPVEETGIVQGQIKTLEEAKDADFDKTWCEMLMNKHKLAIPKLEVIQPELKDEDLKKWISDILPLARTHLDKLMSIHYKLK